KGAPEEKGERALMIGDERRVSWSPREPPTTERVAMYEWLLVIDVNENIPRKLWRLT
ncbi:hypothetical protein NQZ68_018011, partial [Dissostichus eleginoides]